MSTVFVCEMHEVRTLAPCRGLFVFFVVVFSSLENYFGFMATNVKGRTDHSVSLRRINVLNIFKEASIFLIIVHSSCELICVQSASPSIAGLN